MSGYAKIAAEASGEFRLNKENFGQINDAVYQLKYLTFNVQDYGAKGDGVAVDTTYEQAAINAAGTGKTVWPVGSYLTGALTSLIYSKLEGFGATLKPNANSITVLKLKAGSTLADSDYLVVRNLTVDGTGKTGITGFGDDSGATANVGSAVLENLIAAHCDTYGFNFEGMQFCRIYSLRATLCGTGMLFVNDAVAGGANSTDFYHPTFYSNTVGLVVDGTHYGVAIGSLNFYNPVYVGNSVCGMAFFTAEAAVYGGIPELNGTGAATAVVNGLTVKKSDVYLNNSNVLFTNHQLSTVLEPSFVLENNSVLTLSNVSGYGGGVAVQCDSTSSLHLQGLMSATGIWLNLASWPSSWTVGTSPTWMCGAPVFNEDKTLPVLYADRSPALAPAGSNPPTVTTVTDSDCGSCTQVAFQALTGGGFNNMVQVAVGTGAASKDNAFTVLVKADRDCQLGTLIYDGGGFTTVNTPKISLTANKAARITWGMSGGVAGTWYVQFYAGDSTGATVKFSCLQVYQGTAGTNTDLELSKIARGALRVTPSANAGASTQTPGAVATVNIAHGLTATPLDYQVQPGDANARGAPAFYLTADATNITLNFAGNLTAATAYTWRWRAE